MSMGDELRGMVMTFRVSELQMLLGYASQNKTGRKSELQARALALLKNKSVPHLTQIHAKIRELYKTIQQGTAPGEVGNSSLLCGSYPRSEPSAQAPTGPPLIPPPSVSASQSPVVSTAPITATQPPITNSFMSLSSRQSLYNSMYGYQQQPKMPGVPGVVPPYPQQAAIHPDVKIKKLPFYDILSELIKPSSLAGCISSNPTTRGHESSFVFYLSPHQASEVAFNREIGPGSKNEYPVQKIFLPSILARLFSCWAGFGLTSSSATRLKRESGTRTTIRDITDDGVKPDMKAIEQVSMIQLRFCLLETSSEQDDIFPPGISVKVNGKPATLPNPIPTNRPGVEPKRPPRPVNISPLVKLCPFVANHITVSWSPDYSRGYVLVLHLVRKLSAQDLLTKLKTKGIRNADFTTGLIKEKLCETDSDCEIATTSLRVSLLCPLGKMKMTVPARSTLCSHLQCFDASFYLQMNEKRPTWTCPVCDKQIPFDTIVIDGYFQDVLVSPKLNYEQHEVQLLKDGSWSCSIAIKEESTVKAAAKTEEPKEEIEEIIDDGDDEVVSTISVTKKDEKKEKKMIEIDLTASDSDQEERTTINSECLLDKSKTNHSVTVVQSDGSNSSVGGKSMESSSVITLEDSPSPPASPVGLSGPALNPHAASYPLPAGASVLSQSIPVSNHRSSSSSPRNNHMYPQIQTYGVPTLGAHPKY